MERKRHTNGSDLEDPRLIDARTSTDVMLRYSKLVTLPPSVCPDMKPDLTMRGMR
jgi:hypothetical protein